MRLRTVRLESLGHSLARFSPLRLDFTDGVDPVDTVVLLANGGGKTTLASLVWSVVRPDSDEFIATLRDRQYKLHHYVLDRDTGHVALEWEVTPPGALLPVRWVTGQVFEWKGRRNSGELGDLDRIFYGFAPVPGQLDIDHLPIYNDDGRLRPLAEFREELRRAGRMLGVDELVVESVQHQWMTWLDERYLDRELFRQHTVMNGEEGGAANLFAWPDVWSFARTVTELLVDTGRLKQVARTVTNLRDKYAEREGQRADLALCKDAVPALHDVADAYDQQLEARGDLAKATTRAGRTAGHVAAAADRGREQLEHFEADAARLADAEQTAQREFSRADNRAKQGRYVEADVRASASQKHTDHLADELKDAARRRQAWELVGTVHEHDTARERLTDLDAQLAAANDKVAVAQQRAEEAATRYADRLAWDRQLHLEEEDHQLAAALAAEGQEQKVAAEVEALREAINAAERAVVTGNEAEAELAEQISALAADGLVQPLETPAAAAARWHQEVAVWVRAAKQADETEQGALTQERALRAEHRQLDSERTRLEADIVTADKATGGLRQRQDQLAADPVLVGLSDGRGVQLPHDAPVLADLARSHARQLREQASEAERAASDVAGRLGRLGEHGIEASADVRHVTELLHGEHVAAVAGWEWLAKQPAERRDRYVEEDPAAVSGVVVPAGTDAVGRAAAILAGCEVSEPVTVVAPDAFEAGSDAPGRLVVVPPAERYDPDAAARLRADLEGEHAQLIERAEQLTGDASALVVAADQLLSWLADGGAKLETVLLSLKQMRDRALELTSRLEQLDERVAAAVSEQTDARLEREAADGQRRAAEEAARRVGSVLSSQDRTVTLIADAQDAQRRLPALQIQLGASKNAALAARGVQVAAERAAAAASQRADAITDDAMAQQVTLPDGPSQDAEELPPRPALLSVLRGARRDVEQLTPDETLRHERDTLAETVTHTAAVLGRAEGTVGELARQLASSAKAATPSALAAATETAKAAERAADREHALSQKQTAELRTNAQRLAPTGRSHHADLSAYPVPATVADAEALRVQLDGELGTARTRLAEVTRDAEAVAGQASALRQRIDLLDVNAARLRSPLRTARRRLGWEEEAEGSDHSPFDGTTDEAAAAVSAAEQALEDATDTLGAADELLDEAALRCVTVAGRHDGGDAATRERLKQAGMQAYGARELAGLLALRTQMLEGELASMASEREQTVSLVAGHVGELLRLLARLESVSTIPDSIVEWANKPFVKVTLTRPDATELRDRVAAVVDRYLDGGAVPSGLELSIGALKHVLGERGLRVSLLKPTATMATIREPVEAFRASDGQKLTVAILLYCTLARLRYEQRGLDPATAGGLLWLDNPFGKASKPDLVDLQLSVAKKMGVQLVYLTGIRDYDALEPFSRWTSLATAVHRTSGHAHVIESSAYRRPAA